MRQPDIEIYLKDADVDHKQIAEWLAQAIGPCSEWQQKGQTFKCKAGNIPVTWLPKAVGKWNSLYLESDQTPWLFNHPIQSRTLNRVQGRIRKCAHDTDSATKMIEAALGRGRMQTLLITHIDPAACLHGADTT